MVRRDDVRAADIEVVDDELDTEDLEAAGCVVCASGAHRPHPPARLPVTLPAPGTPVPSVAALVADARALAQENRTLRAQYELVSVNNAGLAAHASVLHDRNLALLRHAREGYRAGMVMLEQARLSCERTERANSELEDRVLGLRDMAGRTAAAETQLRVFKASSEEEYHNLQNQLAASQAQVADMSARLAAVPAVAAPASTSTVSMARLFTALGERDDARAERDDLRTRLAAAEAALVSVSTRPWRGEVELASPPSVESGSVTSPSPSVTKRVGTSRRSSRSATQSSWSAIRLDRCPSLWSKLVALQPRRAETESTQRMNDPLQADVRRVNALLVAHAEELQRETARIRELETTAATASTARVVAEAKTARAQANELQAVSRSGQYRTGWLAMRRRLLQQSDATGAHIRRLSVRVADLADERDLAVRERDERAMAWRRMLRDARRSREFAQRVRDDLAGKLASSVSSPFFPLAFFAAFTFSIDFASALPSGFGVAFGVAFPLGFAFIVEFLVALVESLRRLGAFRGVGCFHSFDPLASPSSATHSGGPDDSDGGDSSSSSSARSSSSSSVSSGSEGAAPVVPFFVPVIPPAGTPSGWTQRRYFPWPKSVRRLRLHTITAHELRARFLPPRGWICPRAPVPEPANSNRALVTRANVDALYATRPWRYLAQEVGSVLFASGDAAFQPFMRRLRHHVEGWAQAYWESTHELHVSGAAWRSWRSSRNSRRSHAGDHLNSLLQLVVDLFRRGLADMDLLLDPAVLHFPPAHSRIGRWFPGLQHTTLQEALDDVDAQEPWRRFYRTPLTVAQMDANVRCRVTRAHHAYLVPRLAGKFIQQV
ncbi:hypothetical protein PHYSODRAFT_259165 [Phytophthora sojae]|uniref:Uncharacterized protein n=1 Tax=Phytophthora sojae (strain P6497) TaxID=1094619 RepID=G4ZU40_PHYSP|nr:hypothetical protein PHYSODRAFT_259165 [Phytophthora sojae]EGZ13314.1 hypothetical protein PHYSODRAFT_259165 [Phytophthora sojae]|eukprot:XP_009530743.1 hypothetical protein PHYSODRAFT_259165 [Phytophthora sojae]